MPNIPGLASWVRKGEKILLRVEDVAIWGGAQRFIISSAQNRMSLRSSVGIRSNEARA